MTAPTPPPPAAAPTKKKRWPWIVAAVVVLLGVGAAVGGKKSDPAPAAAAAATTATAASTTSSQPATSALTPSTARGTRDLASRPRPDGSDVQTIAAGLVAIQSDMAELPDRRVESWSDSMCGDIWLGAQGKYSLPQLAVMRFAGGTRPPLTEAQGQQIVDLITTTYCS